MHFVYATQLFLLSGIAPTQAAPQGDNALTDKKSLTVRNIQFPGAYLINYLNYLCTSDLVIDFDQFVCVEVLC